MASAQSVTRFWNGVDDVGSPVPQRVPVSFTVPVSAGGTPVSVTWTTSGMLVSREPESTTIIVPVSTVIDESPVLASLPLPPPTL